MLLTVQVEVQAQAADVTLLILFALYYVFSEVKMPLGAIFAYYINTDNQELHSINTQTKMYRNNIWLEEIVPHTHKTTLIVLMLVLRCVKIVF